MNSSIMSVKENMSHPVILIVDDTEFNVNLLVDTLSADYDVSVAMDGETALRIMPEINPDLILLDIMMPGMDGYEVCRRLKADPKTRDVPVIFLTALADAANEQEGLDLGGIDYITKPFTPVLVRARVRNHVHLRRARLEIEQQRDRLDAAFQDLRKLEKLRDDLVHLVVHDMRSPLSSLIGSIEIALMDFEGQSETEAYGCLKDANRAAQSIIGMISNLLDVSRMESGSMPLQIEAVNLGEVCAGVVERLGGIIGRRQIEMRTAENLPLIDCDRSLMDRTVQNLVGNALKFTPASGCILIEISRESEWIKLSVSDNGPGIPPEYHEKIFQKFGQAELRKARDPNSTGLGLAFCKLAVEAHGGNIRLKSRAGEGSTFDVRIPINKKIA